LFFLTNTTHELKAFTIKHGFAQHVNIKEIKILKKISFEPK